MTMTINAIRQPGLRKRTAPGVEVARLTALSLSVTENAEPLSTASMAIPADDTQVDVGDFVELFDSLGSMGVYRVSGISLRYARGRVQYLTLEHAISTLTGGIVFGEMTYEGDKETAYSVLEDIIGKQPEKFWTIDTSKTAECDYLHSKKESMHFSNCDLLDALLDFQAFLPDETILTYDFSVFPWKVMTLRNPTAVDSEIRLSRNATEASIAYDYTNLITRIYGITGSSEKAYSLTEASKNTSGKAYIDADTINRYGIISAVYTVSDAEDANELYTKCVKQLKRKKNPGVTITISGADLQRISGESLDHFRPGYVCRLCIPEDGLTLQYKVLKVEHGDLCKKAASVTVTMGTDERRTASKKRNEKSSGGGGSTAGPGGSNRGLEELRRAFSTTYFFVPGGSTSFTWGFVVGSEFVSLSAVTLTTTTSYGNTLSITVDDKGGFNAPNSSTNITYYLNSDTNGAVLRDVTHNITFTGVGGETVRATLTIVGKTVK